MFSERVKVDRESISITRGKSAVSISGWGSVKNYLGTMGHCLDRDDCTGLAAEMTYNWMLSLLPTLIFIFALFGMFGVKSNLFEQLMNRLYFLVPADAYHLLEVSLQELTKASNGGVALFSLLGALWTASNGANSIEKALNRAFRCVPQKRGFIRKQAVALLIVLGLGFLLLVCANLIVFGDLIFGLIQQTMHPPAELLVMMGWLRWGIAIGGLVLIISFIYWIAPDVGAKRLPLTQQVLPGALTFVLLWILISWLFSLYVSNLGHFNKIYGSMGAIIILMIWLYLTSYTLIIGGEVNAISSGRSKDSVSQN
jgi:membrane protein